MERDFLGISSKEPLAVVKEEIIDECKDSGMQWSFSNKISALPNFMSFKAAQEMPKKFAADTVAAATGFMSMTTSDTFDMNQKRSTGEIPKTFNQDRKGGTHFSLTAYPVQHEVHRDVKMLPVSNISVSMSNPFFKTHFSTGQNLAGAMMKQQLVGGISVTTPHSIVPSVGSIPGVIEPRNNSKASGSPAQLTIFYAGTVKVFDDISPEKAQAIMFLAGNGSSIVSKPAHPRPQVQASTSKLTATDAPPVNQSMNTLPSSGHSSPISVSSNTGAQSGSGSTSTDELMTAKTSGAPITTISKVDSPKVVNMSRPLPTSMMTVVPQARNASLARFLKKRKERAMNSAPYNMSMKSPECATPESSGLNVPTSSPIKLGE